jgi:TetR/AcrR family transcriptional regulator
MSSSRRIGSEKSKTRDAIIEAAVEVLQDEGATKLTASRVAERASVKPHMVHYYFRSMDDLIVAVVRQHGLTGVMNTARSIASSEPLRGLWQSEMEYKWGAAAMEFGAIAAHREAVRTEMKHYIEEMRTQQAEAIRQHLAIHGFETSVPPIAMTIILAAVARQLVRERAMGVSLGHEETVAFVEQFLNRFGNEAAGDDGPKKTKPRQRKAG